MTVGVLAPIGRPHLEAAEAEGMTTVVFGTNAWEFWRLFIDEVGTGCPMLFYESWGPAIPHAAWAATLAEYEEAPSGFPPKAWRRYREPVAAIEDTGAGPGFFAAYYRVEGLARLESPMPFGDLRTYATDKSLDRNFIPIGPLAVHW